MKFYFSGVEYIATRLRMIRRERGLTQVQLAERAGTTETAVQKIENGKSLQPRSIMDLAEALDVNPAWLQFGGPYAMRKRPD